MTEDYPVYARLSTQKLSQLGIDPILAPENYEPGCTCHYCSVCQDYSLLWDEEDGVWYCDNCDSKKNY